jgi:hypothetical protein
LFSLEKDGISLEQFKRLDEEHLTAALEMCRPQFPQGRGRTALTILLNSPSSYECKWISTPVRTSKGTVELIPPDLFFDSFSDYQEHSLFAAGSIKIESSRFGRDTRRFLEDCSSPFRELGSSRWSGLESQNSVLLYLPKSRKTPAWHKFEPLIDSYSAYSRYWAEDPFSNIEFPSDTTSPQYHFEGKPIFISFHFDDIAVVNKIVDVLYSRRRKYFLLSGEFDGYGIPTDLNSKRAAERAGCALLVLSRSYIERLRQRSSNIAAEFGVLSARRKRDSHFIVAFVKTDKQTTLRGFPYHKLRISPKNYIGRSLRLAGRDAIESGIDRILKVLDGKSN